VLNNPLKYIDPTGYVNWGWIAVGAVVLEAVVVTGGIAASILISAIVGEVAVACSIVTIGISLDAMVATGMLGTALGISGLTGAGLIYRGATMDSDTPDNTIDYSQFSMDDIVAYAYKDPQTVYVDNEDTGFTCWG
jgi:hypothetical protein